MGSTTYTQFLYAAAAAVYGLLIVLLLVSGRANNTRTLLITACAATGASWRVARPDGGQIGRAVLRYRLTGVFVRPTPAPPRRFTLVLRHPGAVRRMRKDTAPLRN